MESFCAAAGRKRFDPGPKRSGTGYYVVTSTPRDNASLFDPIGLTVAQITRPGVLVQEIDLSFAILHWSETLREGQALTQRFGSHVDYRYLSREDTGLFWSNDPERSIGSMVSELGLEPMSEMVQRIEAARQHQRLAESGQLAP